MKDHTCSEKDFLRDFPAALNTPCGNDRVEKNNIPAIYNVMGLEKNGAGAEDFVGTANIIKMLFSSI